MGDNVCSNMFQIYSGTDDSGPSLSQICHTSKSVVLTSSGNSMFVTFKSDIAYSGKGFKASYKMVNSSKSIIMIPQNHNLLSSLSYGFLCKSNQSYHT
jgi:hypothetical protein